jgi:hypothetical protein
MLLHRPAAFATGAVDPHYGWYMDREWELERRKERLRELKVAIGSPFVTLDPETLATPSPPTSSQQQQQQPPPPVTPNPPAPTRPPDDPQRVNRPNAHQIYPDGKPHQLYAVSNEPRNVRRLVILWFLGKLMGEPPPCAHCQRVMRVLGRPSSEAPRASQSHLVICGGLVTDIDALLRQGKYVVAASVIRRRLQQCVTDHRREVILGTGTE